MNRLFIYEKQINSSNNFSLKDYCFLNRRNSYSFNQLKTGITTRIEKIIPIKRKFYDLTVYGNHFIANGIIAHNTGKTTCIRGLIENLNINEERVAMCCFTGKAASVLRSKGFKRTKTLHSTFYDPLDETEIKKVKNKKTGIEKDIFHQNVYFNLKKKDLIKSQYDLIIIDEFSMVDSNMFEDIKSFGIPIIVLGDSFQLPAIGDNKLTEIYLKKPDFQLTKILRQAEDNPILRVATLIRIGVEDPFTIIKKGKINKNYLDNTGKVTIFSEKAIFKNFEEQILQNFNKNFCNITYSNKKRSELNRLFRLILFNLKSKDPPIKGEKLICRKNNSKTLLTNQDIKFLRSDTILKEMIIRYGISKYNLVDKEKNYTQEEIDELTFYYLMPIFNGTIGRLLSDTVYKNDSIQLYDFNTKKWHTQEIVTSLFDFKPDFTSEIEYFEDVYTCVDNLIDKDKEASKVPYYGVSDLNFFNFGYCITGHSSQGSEYDRVAIWHEIPNIGLDALTIRRWYYTVITRAKKKLVIIGN